MAQATTQQRVVLVTGGMGGLGETISTKMADAGYRVVAHQGERRLGFMWARLAEPQGGAVPQSQRKTSVEAAEQLLQQTRRRVRAAPHLAHLATSPGASFGATARACGTLTALMPASLERAPISMLLVFIMERVRLGQYRVRVLDDDATRVPQRSIDLCQL